jgi:hypothetical protein
VCAIALQLIDLPEVSLPVAQQMSLKNRAFSASVTDGLHGVVLAEWTCVMP